MIVMDRTDILLYCNAFLIFAAWFGMWGNLWVGHGSFSRAEFRGAYTELQEHKKHEYDVDLSFGLLTYSIDYWHDEVRTQGLPTFCWTQLFLLVLVAVDILGLTFFLKERVRAWSNAKPLHLEFLRS